MARANSLKSGVTHFYRVGIPNSKAYWGHSGNTHGQRGLSKTSGNSGGCGSHNSAPASGNHVKMQTQACHTFTFLKIEKFGNLNLRGSS